MYTLNNLPQTHAASSKRLSWPPDFRASPSSSSDRLSLKAYRVNRTLHYTAGLIHATSVGRSGWANTAVDPGGRNENDHFQNFRFLIRVYFSLCIICIRPYPFCLPGKDLSKCIKCKSPLLLLAILCLLLEDEPASVSAWCLWGGIIKELRCGAQPVQTDRTSRPITFISGQWETHLSHISFLGIISPCLLLSCVLFVDGGLSACSLLCL